MKVNGSLMKTLGRLLLEARTLCEKHHASFGDYLDRVLCIPRTSASTIIKSHLFDLKPEIGFENMRTLTRIKNDETRRQAEEALLAGPDGLEIHRRIIKQAQPYLADQAVIMLETAYNQAEPVIALCRQSGYLNNITAVRDNLGHKRVVKATRK